MARLVRGVKPQKPRPKPDGSPCPADSATMKLAAGAGETARGREALKDDLTREPEQSCEGQNPMSVAGSKSPGQAAINARSASPVRVLKERQPRMARAGDVSI